MTATSSAPSMPAVELRPEGIALVERPRPRPGPGEVLLRVEAAGLCRSDLALAARPPAAHPFELPVVLGHEIAGVVVARGPGTDAVPIGEPVVVYGPRGCGICRSCRRGHDNRCARAARDGLRPVGLGRDGGLATHVAVPARDVLPRGGLPAVVAAPLTDAGLTAWHAVRLGIPSLRAASTAVVIGVGGLGHLALQLLAAHVDTQVIAVDRSPSARELACRLGAEAVADVALLEEHVSERTDGHGAGLVLDLVASAATLKAGVASLAPGGELSVVGVGAATVEVAMGRLPYDASVRTPYWGQRDELAHVLTDARAGRLHVEIETVSLQQVPESYERLRRGEVSGRLVAVPDANGPDDPEERP